MKNILILYATNWGVTKQCAEMLEKQLNQRYTVTVMDIQKERPALSEYDVVILGSNIRMGKINRAMKKLLQEEAEYLSSVPTAVYLCLGYPRQFEEYAELELPKKLTCSLGVHCFGGELKPEKLRGIDKWIVKMVRNSIRTQDFEESDTDHHQLPEILPENIVLLADKIKSLN
ncbi:MAG: hypothetical protein IJY47_06345 [Clostridia bacterium]|nr:hypothetical protein [Clostridia bacterium]